MTRTGKIARLPAWVRERLNRRLDNGQQGKHLVEWLNGLGDVQECIDEEFPGRPITEQNLSEWKKGGFQDWLRHQESRNWVRVLSQEAEEVAEESGVVPLSDRLASIVAVALGRMLRDAAAGQLDKPENRRELLGLARELAQLRRDDHRAARLRHELEQQAEARERKRERAEEAAERAEEMKPFHHLLRQLAKEQMIQPLTKHMPPEEANTFRILLGMPPNKVTPTNGADPDPGGTGLDESHSIRFNPT